MSYGKASDQEYGRRRNLRQIWGSGMTKALSQIERLKKEGWVFEVNRGAMTKDQADYFMQVADRMGNETIRISVTDAEHPTVFVGYKPTSRQKQKRQAPTPPPKKQPILDPIKAWEKKFYKRKPEDMSEVDGAVMNPSRSMAVLRPGASNRTLSDLLEKAVTQAGKIVDLEYRKITAAEKAVKKMGQKLKYLEFLEGSIYDVGNIKIALSVLGCSRKGRATAYLESAGQPIAVKDDATGWSVIIAPLISPTIDHPDEKATIETINTFKA